MKIFRFYEAENTISLRPDSFEDLYLLARIIAPGDGIEAESKRRFKPTEGDTGEQKDIYVGITVEKVELDKVAGQLRLTGKIINGKPERFVQIGSYHTINISAGGELKIKKPLWKSYLIKRLREAVEDSKKVTMGIVVLDEEKALAAYVRGYGIDLLNEVYSNLSKRMSEKEFKKQNEAYFNEVISIIKEMSSQVVVVAGPGFTKDNLKKYIEANGININKKLVYVHASSAERSGIREALQDEKISMLLTNEQLKKEFSLFNLFLDGLRANAAFYGVDQVKEALSEYKVGIVMVNDNVINGPEFQEVLDIADRDAIKIEIFNSSDEAGEQLAHFKNIAAISKGIISVKGGH